MSKVNSLRMDMQETSSYRLGWTMAANGKQRPFDNFLTFLRENGHSTFFVTEQAFDAAKARHKLRLMGWDDCRAAELAA
jgi:hypothetical protein